jgi:hypothetical protein
MRTFIYCCALAMFFGSVDLGNCLAQDLCSLTTGARGFYASRNDDAFKVLDTIGKVIPFQTRTLMILQSSDRLVRERGGAAAEICNNGTQRWIFYDPQYIESIRDSSDLARYFVLAHEIAHHINGDTLNEGNWNRDQELAADYAAAVWLSRLGVTQPELLKTFDSLQIPAESINGYPTRAERRARVVAGSSPNPNLPPPVTTGLPERSPIKPTEPTVNVIFRWRGMMNVDKSAHKYLPIRGKVSVFVDGKFIADVSTTYVREQDEVQLTPGVHTFMFESLVHTSDKPGVRTTCRGQFTTEQDSVFIPQATFFHDGELGSCQVN